MSNDLWCVTALFAGVALTLAIVSLYFSAKHLDDWDRGYQAGYKKAWKEAFSFGKEDVLKENVCPSCGKIMTKDESIVYTSLPPQYKYKCSGCGREMVKT